MSISRAVLAKYIKPGDRFVETGTRWGDTALRARELGAEEVWTIEADMAMARLAVHHIADAAPTSKINVVRGLSFEELPKIPPAMVLFDRVVVFLDAHTEYGSPVMEELFEIGRWKAMPEVILIDDMRLMPSWGVRPSEIKGWLTDRGYGVSYEDGVAPEDIMVGVIK